MMKLGWKMMIFGFRFSKFLKFKNEKKIPGKTPYNPKLRIITRVTLPRIIYRESSIKNHQSTVTLPRIIN